MLLIAAFLCNGLYAAEGDEVTDVNSIEELLGKTAGTYKLHLQPGTMVYGAYNDEWSGAYVYLWDGNRGLRVNGQYEGKLKDFVDANPVGKAIEGTMTVVYQPSTINGSTVLCNTVNDERCSFDATVGEKLDVEPKAVTIAELNAAAKEGHAMDFAYVSIHGYTEYKYNKYMFDDAGDRMWLTNPGEIVPPADFNAANDNMIGTLCAAYIQEVDPQSGVSSYTLGVVNNDWYTAEKPRETTSVEFDADQPYDMTKGYHSADVTIKNLTFTKGEPALINFPFAMTAEQVKANFGEGTKLYYMDNYKGNHKLTTDEATFDLQPYNWAKDGTEAEKIYAIIPGKDVTADTPLEFDGVAISEYQAEGHNSYTDWSTFEKIQIWGTYSPKEIDATTCLVFGKDGSLVAPTSKVKGFTGYFEVPASVIAGKGATVVLNDAKEGSSCDFPFAATIGGENTLPKEAGTYYYQVLPESAGYITAVTETKQLEGGNVKVVKTCDDYLPLTSCENTFAVRFKVDPTENPQYIICVTKATATENDEKITITEGEAQPGDSFDNPITVTPSNLTAPEFNGDYYYKIEIEDDELKKFLVVDAQGKASNSSTNFKLYAGDDPEWGLADDVEKKLRYEVENGKAYVIKLHNAESKAFDFSVMLEEIRDGETMSCALQAVLGKNELPDRGYENTWYKYTMATDNVLKISVADPVMAEIYDSNGDYMFQQYDGSAYSTTETLATGTTCYIRFVGIDGDTSFTLSEGTTTGINAAYGDEGLVSVSGGKITTQGNASVWTLNGVKIAEGNGQDGFNVGKGVYIVKAGGKTMKVVVR